MKEKIKNALSETQILEAIKQYADSEVDYAIMLNGPWGSGKTYFIENQLKQELTHPQEGINSKMSYLYLSLYGIKNVEQFRNELYSCIIKHFSNTLQKASNIAGLLLDITAGSNEHTRILTQSANKIIKSQEKKVVHNKLSSDLFLVVDDLERYEGNDYKELLGFITSKCLNNHVHVLFVCSEDNLLSFGQEKRENYFLIKEKSIRHTISYHAEVHKILLSILDNENRYPTLNKYKKQHTPEISKLFRTLENERNIRTWFVAFDSFEVFAKSYKDEIIQKHPYFLNILRAFVISSSVYNKFCFAFEKKEPVSKEEQDILTKDIETFIEALYQTHYASSPFESLYSREFHLTYPSSSFFKCDAIFELIQTGYLNFQEVKEHFEKVYPIDSKYEIAVSNLLMYRKLSESDMTNVFNDIREGLTNGKYDIRKAILIYSLASDLEENQYLNVSHQEDLIPLIEAYIKNYDFNFIDEEDLITLKNKLEKEVSPFYTTILGLIQKTLESKKTTKKHDTIDYIISSAESSEYDITLSTIPEFVKDVVETNSFNRIVSLSSSGLYMLSFWFDDIQKDENLVEELQGSIETFYNELSKHKKEKVKSKWDIDFNLFLQSVSGCTKYTDS